MERQQIALLAAAGEGVGSGIAPHIAAISAILAELDVVAVPAATVLEHKHKLVLAAVERAHPAIVLDPDTEVFQLAVGLSASRQQRDLYERFLGATPRLFARYHAHRHLSLIHGDAHVWNYFLPRDGTDDIRLFDWDAWRIGVASNDLAYMMATHWYPDRQRRMEQALLDHYHAALTAHGVCGYDRRALDDDYRLSALWQIMTPVWQSAIDLPAAIWWSHLERIMLAVDDLGCRDLLA